MQLVTDLMIESVPEDARERLTDAILDGIIHAVESFGLTCGGVVKLVEVTGEEGQAN